MNMFRSNIFVTQHARRFTLTVLLAVLVIGGGLASATTATAMVAWSVQSLPDPTHFSPNDETVCVKPGRCDRYQLVIRNVGDETSTGPIEVTDTLPVGITTTGKGGAGRQVEGRLGESWECTQPEESSEEVHVVKCMDAAPVPPEGYATVLVIPTKAPSPESPILQHGEWYP